MKFFQLMTGEWKKSFRTKNLLIFGAVLLIAFILCVVSVSMLSAFPEMGTEEIGVPSDPTNLSYIASAEMADEVIDSLRVQWAAVLEEKYTNPSAYHANGDQLYAIKAKIKAIEYLKDNNLYGQNIYLYQPSNGMIIHMFNGTMTGHDFIGFAAQLMSVAVVVMMITVSAGSIANELKSGTIKLMMIRPVSRARILSAKLASIAVAGVILYTIAFLLAVIYGAASFGLPASNTIYVFNATNAFAAGAGFGTFTLYIEGLITVLTMSMFAFTVGLLTKNQAIGIVLPLLGILGAAEFLLSLMRLSVLPLSYQTHFSGYFAAETGGFAVGSNYFLSLTLLVLYWAAMVVASYKVFKKRDIV